MGHSPVPHLQIIALYFSFPFQTLTCSETPICNYSTQTYTRTKPMVSSDRKLANAVAVKFARACDSCVRKRARWYCAADDAFLCQSCDSSVHSANPLARRHERVRLKTASFGSSDKSKGKLQISSSSWHQGFTRKARTPRQKKHGKVNPLHLVPELCSEEQCNEENKEQLLYRVPIFDPFEVSANTVQKDAENRHRFGQGMALPSEMDLAEFAADVESLLGKGLDDESFDMEGLGILDSQECSLKMIKFEDEDIGEEAMAEKSYQIDMGRETFELNFDCGSPIKCEEEEERKRENGEGIIFKNKCKVDDSNKTFLRLDFEDVISAWDEQKSPWTTGERPELNSGDFGPDCLGTSGAMHVYGDMGTVSGKDVAAIADGGREARVSRYREKRRTRLFSKKIRYEVRKLNAEKRPRMKGRFVKRANFVASAFPLLNK